MSLGHAIQQGARKQARRLRSFGGGGGGRTSSFFYHGFFLFVVPKGQRWSRKIFQKIPNRSTSQKKFAIQNRIDFRFSFPSASCYWHLPLFFGFLPTCLSPWSNTIRLRGIFCLSINQKPNFRLFSFKFFFRTLRTRLLTLLESRWAILGLECLLLWVSIQSLVL